MSSSKYASLNLNTSKVAKTQPKASGSRLLVLGRGGKVSKASKIVAPKPVYLPSSKKEQHGLNPSILLAGASTWANPNPREEPKENRADAPAWRAGSGPPRSIIRPPAAEVPRVVGSKPEWGEYAEDNLPPPYKARDQRSADSTRRSSRDKYGHRVRSPSKSPRRPRSPGRRSERRSSRRRSESSRSHSSRSPSSGRRHSPRRRKHHSRSSSRSSRSSSRSSSSRSSRSRSSSRSSRSSSSRSRTPSPRRNETEVEKSRRGYGSDRAHPDTSPQLAPQQQQQAIQHQLAIQQQQAQPQNPHQQQQQIQQTHQQQAPPKSAWASPWKTPVPAQAPTQKREVAHQEPTATRTSLDDAISKDEQALRMRQLAAEKKQAMEEKVKRDESERQAKAAELLAAFEQKKQKELQVTSRSARDDWRRTEGDARAEEYGPASRSWYAPGGGAQQQANARWEHSNEANGIGWNQGFPAAASPTLNTVKLLQRPRATEATTTATTTRAVTTIPASFPEGTAGNGDTSFPLLSSVVDSVVGSPERLEQSNSTSEYLLQQPLQQQPNKMFQQPSPHIHQPVGQLRVNKHTTPIGPPSQRQQGARSNLIPVWNQTFPNPITNPEGSQSKLLVGSLGAAAAAAAAAPKPNPALQPKHRGKPRAFGDRRSEYDTPRTWLGDSGTLTGEPKKSISTMPGSEKSSRAKKSMREPRGTRKDEKSSVPLLPSLNPPALPLLVPAPAGSPTSHTTSSLITPIASSTIPTTVQSTVPSTLPSTVSTVTSTLPSAVSSRGGKSGQRVRPVKSAAFTPAPALSLTSSVLTVPTPTMPTSAPASITTSVLVPSASAPAPVVSTIVSPVAPLPASPAVPSPAPATLTSGPSTIIVPTPTLNAGHPARNAILPVADGKSSPPDKKSRPSRGGRGGRRGGLDGRPIVRPKLPATYPPTGTNGVVPTESLLPSPSVPLLPTESPSELTKVVNITAEQLQKIGQEPRRAVRPAGPREPRPRRPPNPVRARPANPTESENKNSHPPISNPVASNVVPSPLVSGPSVVVSSPSGAASGPPGPAAVAVSTSTVGHPTSEASNPAHRQPCVFKPQRTPRPFPPPVSPGFFQPSVRPVHSIRLLNDPGSPLVVSPSMGGPSVRPAPMSRGRGRP